MENIDQIKILDISPYNSFEQLKLHEIEGTDFEIKIEKRDSQVLIMAPHGGRIEFDTTEIAERLAKNRYSFYSLVGLKDTGNRKLHISSNTFDEPQGVEMANSAKLVLTIHGMEGED